MHKFKDFYNAIKFCVGKALDFTKREIVFVVIVFIFAGSLPYLSNYYLGQLINGIVEGVKNNDFQNIYWPIFIYAIVSGLPTIVDNYKSYFTRIWQGKFSNKIDIFLLESREKQDIANIENSDFQNLIQRAFRAGATPIINIVRYNLTLVYDVSKFIIGTIVAIHFNPLIYIVVVLSAIPSFIIDVKFSRMSWDIWRKITFDQRVYNDLRQHVTGRYYLIELKLLQAGKKFISSMDTLLDKFYSNRENLEKNRAIQSSIADVVALLGFSFGIFLVVNQVVKGQINIGNIIFLLSTLTMVRGSIGSILVDISSQYEDSLSVGDIMQFVNTKPVIIESKNPIKMSLKSAPIVEFQNVSFKYANNSNYSLKNINLTFKAGDNIGLVGNNGAGKTTLVKLLCRIYDPTEGRILINGVDLRDVSTKEWWSYLAVMFQDYASYDFTVKEAIAVGRSDKNLNLTKVIEASKVSQSDDFIKEWENKYDEQLGVEFKGKEPSKGQRQKLSIAKTLYRDGYVMVLDEPTASVDAESEAKIFDSIENLPKDRTAILISHDFSTISQCDKIFVLEHGTLKEEGSHKELMKIKGLYAELYNLQAKRFKK